MDRYERWGDGEDGRRRGWAMLSGKHPWPLQETHDSTVHARRRKERYALQRIESGGAAHVSVSAALPTYHYSTVQYPYCAA